MTKIVAHPFRICLILSISCCLFTGCASKRSITFLQSGLAAVPIPPEPPTTFNQKQEMRAGWIIGWRQMVSTAAIDEAISLAEAGGLNTLFAQARVSSDAYYKSDFVPRAEALIGQPSEFDPLDYVVRKGHEKGFKVHAWLNMGVVWRSSITLPADPRHIFNAHTDWVLRDADGKMSFPDPGDPQPGLVEENYWINWNNPDARKHLAAVTGELARRYPVDGIHYDFVRYPARMGAKTAGAGYDPLSVSTFYDETGLSPIEHTQQWDEWRAKQITTTLKDCRDEIKKVRPEIPVSAAVLGAWNLAYGRVFTSYRSWLDNDLLDFVVLMSYYKDTTQNWQSVINARETADSRKIVLGLYLPYLSPEAAAGQLLFSREQDLKGFSLFALDNIEIKEPKPYLERLRALAISPAEDTRYKEKEPLWNRVGIIDATHRKFSFRFFSRVGKTKLVVYQWGLTELRFSINDQQLQPLLPSAPGPIQFDLSDRLKPFERQVVANHDFTLNIEADGPQESFAQIFTVDYYKDPLGQ